VLRGFKIEKPQDRRKVEKPRMISENHSGAEIFA
jgi:hypothetical protein